jgi:hypothetical protein
VVLSLAPATGPTTTVSAINPHSITFTWKPLACIERNGEIIGYKVMFYEVGHADELGVPLQVIGESFTASNLIPGRGYTLKVAAVNEYGTGPYHSVRNVITTRIGMPTLCIKKGGFLCLLINMHCSNCMLPI